VPWQATGYTDRHRGCALLLHPLIGFYKFAHFYSFLLEVCAWTATACAWKRLLMLNHHAYIQDRRTVSIRKN
jgi:hypothetical protein